MVLRVNHEKFAVLLRDESLIKLASQSISEVTAKVYEQALRAIEPRIRAFRDTTLEHDGSQTEINLSTLPKVTTDDLLEALQGIKELSTAIGMSDGLTADLIELDHLKKRRKKDSESEDDVMVDGDPSQDREGDEASKDEESEFPMSSDPDQSASEAEDYLASNAKHDPQRRSLRDHLLLLARHPFKFLRHIKQISNHPESWTVPFPSLVESLQHYTVMQTITARHGQAAARITRILAEKGKVDEKNLWTLSLINQKTMRSYISTLHKAGVIGLQEIPRDNSRNVQRTMFLWFFDEDRYKSKMLQETYKSMARCLQRIKVEREKVKATEEKANRTDVIGREEKFLSLQEREALAKWRDVEAKVRSEIGRLDEIVAVLRNF